MFGTPFYNEGLRKIIIAFGQLFNNIVIENTNRTTGAVTKRIKVPLAYAPKEKFLVRLEQQPDLTDRSFAITFTFGCEKSFCKGFHYFNSLNRGFLPIEF